MNAVSLYLRETSVSFCIMTLTFYMAVVFEVEDRYGQFIQFEYITGRFSKSQLIFSRSGRPALPMTTAVHQVGNDSFKGGSCEVISK
jgi:hypothetical protein